MEIYGTMGPACDREEILESMFCFGMTGMRINMSHSNLSSCGAWIKKIRAAARAAGKDPKLLIDLQGPELRIGAIEETVLSEEEVVCLCQGEALACLHKPETADEKEREQCAGKKTSCGSRKTIPVPLAVLHAVRPGSQVLLDDGKLLLTVDKVSENTVYCSVERGGALKPRKSIAVPGTEIRTPTLTESDLENIAGILDFHITGVMLPFVRGAEDLWNLRQALKEAGAGSTRIFAKLENLQGVEALPKLLKEVDEIVIARGDLGNAMALWQLPVVQARIAESCRKAGKPFMVVTQMLASMEQNPVPTRAEVSDIFRAVLEGAESVMVTGETAAGKYPAETMEYLCNTVNAALDYRETIIP